MKQELTEKNKLEENIIDFYLLLKTKIVKLNL